MRNGYDHHHSIPDNHFHHKNNIFLPMFCRLSIKDVNLNNHYRDPVSAAEPSSPKVSCIGQVKRNNRVTGFPAAATVATVNHHKPPKLNKLFSSKNLFPTTITLKAGTAAKSGVSSGGGGGGRTGSRSCRTSKEMRVNNSRRSRQVKSTDCDQDCGKVVVVDVGEMDPPLPVVKRVAPQGVGRDEVNIWKRRFSGVGLKSLQIEQIHSSNNKFEPSPTTV